MDAKAQRDREFVPLGYISGVHGVKGWVKIHSWTRPREAIFDYRPWLLGQDRHPVAIRQGRRQGKALVAELPGVEDRETARSLVEMEIAVHREQLAQLEAGEFYWSDLVGLEVVTITGVVLGTVERLIETGANDVLIVRGDRERLLPFVMGQYITRVDLEAGRIEVDWYPDF
jgi:16S rRNA processing protein RimM